MLLPRIFFSRSFTNLVGNQNSTNGRFDDHRPSSFQSYALCARTLKNVALERRQGGRSCDSILSKDWPRIVGKHCCLPDYHKHAHPTPSRAKARRSINS